MTKWRETQNQFGAALGSGLSIPIFQYFQSHSSLLCHYCVTSSVFIWVLFGSHGAKPVPFCDELNIVEKSIIYRKSPTQNGPKSMVMLVALSGHGPDHACWALGSLNSFWYTSQNMHMKNGMTPPVTTAPVGMVQTVLSLQLLFLSTGSLYIQ